MRSEQFLRLATLQRLREQAEAGNHELTLRYLEDLIREEIDFLRRRGVNIERDGDGGAPAA